MATYTISSSLNIDALVLKTGADTYNINGGYLTVDQDSRYGKNQSITSSLGNIAMSATLGGTVEFNSTLVRLIPFSGGAGNVPSNTGSFIYQGTASGSLLGVYSGSGGLGRTPLTGSSQTMPETGFIKIRQWNSQPFVINVPLSSSISTFSATASAADGPGWLEIVGEEALTATVNRLNTFKIRGDWYTFQDVTSSGVNTTTYQIPSNGSAVYAPGVWVETAVASNAYDFYPCAGTQGSTVSNIGTDAIRGKACWISTAGLLRFAHDGTLSAGGYLVPNGRRLRIPNIFFVNCTAADRQTNALPNATLATRYDFTTTGAGNVDIDKASMCWFPSFAQPYSVKLSNVGFATQLNCSEIAAPISWSQVGVGQEAANPQLGLSLATCFAGGTMSDCTWSTSTLASVSRFVTGVSDCNSLLITNEKLIAFSTRSSTSAGGGSYSRLDGVNWKGQIQTGRNVFTTCKNIEMSGSIYFDCPSGNTIATNPMNVWELATACDNMTFNGLSFGGLNYVQPFTGILSIGTSACKNIKLRNIGSYNSPLDMGGPQRDVDWSRVTTTATVTSPSHGLTTGHTIYVLISSSAGAIVVGAKTITVTGANTFTFVALNAGSDSGRLTYYLTVCGNLLLPGTSAVASSIKVQRCYVPHMRGGITGGDNSNKNVTFENVHGEFPATSTIAMLNTKLKGIGQTLALPAQTAVYGTLWFDSFISSIPETSSNVVWGRVGTSVSISGSNHNLRAGLFINVVTSSSEPALRVGQYTINATASNVIVVTGLTVGATSGTLTYVPYTGRVGIQMNETTSDNASSVIFESGSASFTSVGTIVSDLPGDQTLFTTPDYIIGHTSFSPGEMTMAGGVVADYDITYALNTGSTYSSYRNFNINRSGSWATGSLTASVASTSGIEVGDWVWGTNIYPNAMVTSILSTSSIALDRRHIGTTTGSLRFNHLPSEGTIPDLGFKMKVRLKRMTTGSRAGISSIYWHTNSTTSSRALQYPLETNTLNIDIRDADGNYITSPCEVTVVNDADTSILYTAEDVITGNTQYTYTYNGDITTYINVLNIDTYEPKTISPVVLSNSDQTISIQLDPERGKYSNP